MSRTLRSLASIATLLALSAPILAQDKSAGSIVQLPSAGGTVTREEGSFGLNTNTGSANFRLPLPELPTRGGFGPQIALAYNQFAGDTGSGHDVVLLFNVVHGFPADVARGLVERAVAALRPGGTLLLLETTPQPRGGVADTAFTRCFGLNLFHTQGGQVYPLSTLAGWLVAAGCAEPEQYDLERSTSHVLLAARRTATSAPAGP
jgi:hypothetical protein